MAIAPLLAHFAAIADAPGGVARLRQLILQLAVQGRLVEQDAGDEPASALLKRIREEKARLVKAGIIGKARSITEDLSSKFPFTIPTTWVWVQLSEVCHDWGQKTPDALFTYIDVSAIDNKRGVISSEVSVLEPAEAPSRARKLVRPGTLIYSTVRPYLLNIAIVDREFTPEPIVSTAFAILHPLEGIYNRYIYYYLRSQPFIDYVAGQMKGVAYPAINDGQFFSGLVPLPPLAEQRRIVARVDALMAMCDALEQRQAQQGEGRRRLLAALVAEILAPPEKTCQVRAQPSTLDREGHPARAPDRSSSAWARLSDSFALVLAAPEDVAPLRQAVLQLAVQGRLVEQDADDEPASVLLERIRAEKARLVKEGKLKKAEASAPVTANDQPFKVPQGWEWVRLQDLIIFGPSNGISPKAVEVPTAVKSLTLTATTSGKFDGRHFKYLDTEIPQNSDLWLEDGDVLVQRGNTIEYVGVPAVYRGSKYEYVYPDLMMKVRPSSQIDVAYLHAAMSSRPLRDYLRRRATGTSGSMPKINHATLVSLPFPLPPLAEQRRIVVRVEQLMALCDALEARLREERAAAERLAEALCAAVVATPMGGDGAPAARGEALAEVEEPVATDAAHETPPVAKAYEPRTPVSPLPRVHIFTQNIYSTSAGSERRGDRSS